MQETRIRMLSHCLMFVEGKTIAGSLSLNSRVTGASYSAAASTTLHPTSSEPMNVI